MKNFYLHLFIIQLIMIFVQQDYCQNNYKSSNYDVYKNIYSVIDQKFVNHNSYNIQVDDSITISLDKVNNTSIKDVYGNKLLASEESQQWDGVGWQTHNKWIYNYDNLMNLSEWIYQMYNSYESDKIDWQQRKLYTYDKNGNLIIKQAQLWNTSQEWYNVNRLYYKYDGNGHKILDSLEIWNDSLGIWKSSTKNIYSYDEKNNVIEILEKYLINGSYFNGSRWLYQFDQNNNLLEERSQGWDNTDWITYHVRSYSYDKANNKISYILQDWDGLKLDYIIKYLYSYDENNNNTEFIGQDWQDSVWINNYKKDYLYDQNNLLIKTSNFYWNIDQWYLSSRDFYSYDEKGNKTLALEQSRRDTTFINSYRYIFTYDLDNNLVSQVQQLWDGTNWVNNLRNYSIYIPKFGNNDFTNNFWLFDNYPNPFNSSTTIRFFIPWEELVTITIYDILGQKVRTLVNENKIAGVYETTWNANNMSSGIYIYQLKAGDYIESKKMILLK